MDNLKKKNLVITLLLLISFFFFLSSSSSTNEFHPKNLGWSPTISPHEYDDDMMIKNAEPPHYFLKKQITGGGLITTNNNSNKKKKKMKTRALNLKKSSREKGTSSDWSRKRTYSAMLPKGFVPPSGSSPCHNTYPNSITFFCHLISPKTP
ncbi:hypothetical protein HAX54_049481 [Datura stramonium]|uniref:Transmembrane protein n=1 Tax=Datura stramonium TaxID=4076 RepID=A0ABS8RQN4_DATST|nr:hypothetical protein [Datura stramonium]